MSEYSWYNVRRWPRWLRRIFILTIPVSGPLYIVCYLVGWVMFFLLLFPIAFFNTYFWEYWDDPPPPRDGWPGGPDNGE